MASPRFLEDDNPLALLEFRPLSPLAWAPLPTAKPPTGKPPKLWADLWGLVADCPLNSLHTEEVVLHHSLMSAFAIDCRLLRLDAEIQHSA